MARAVKDADPALKAVVARVALVASSVLGLGGAVAITRVGIGLLLPVLRAAVVGLGSTVLAALPVIAVMAMLGLTVKTAMGAFGITFSDASAVVTSAMRSAHLAIRGVIELVTRGGLGDSMRRELDSAGLTNFVIRVGMVAHRVKTFFVGIAAGFRATFNVIKPTVVALGTAFVSLGEALGVVSRRGKTAGRSIPGASVFKAGAVVGTVMARVIQGIAGAMTVVVRVGAGFVRGLRSVFSAFSGVFTGLMANVEGLGKALGISFGGMSSGAEGSGNTIEKVGASIAKIVGVVIVAFVEFLSVGTRVLTSILNAFNALGKTGRGVLGFLVEGLGKVVAILIGVKLAKGIANITGLTSAFRALKGGATGVAGAVGALSGDGVGVGGSGGRGVKTGVKTPGTFGKAAGGATKALRALGPAASLAQAALAGFAVGTALDQWTGASDKISNWFTNRSGRGDGSAAGTKFDPTGRAGNLRQHAKNIQADLEKSHKILRTFASNGPVFAKIASRIRQGKASKTEKAIFKANTSGFYAEETDLTGHTQSMAARGEIRDVLREAAAIETAQRIAQSENLAKGLAEAGLEEKFRDAQIVVNDRERGLLAEMLSREISKISGRPIVVKVDQETLAVAVTEGQRQSEGRGFQVVGPGTES
jgi:hypothetical protein